MVCNIDIRSELMARGLRQYQVAAVMGITEEHFSRLLRKELPKERKEEIRQAVNKIVSQKEE